MLVNLLARQFAIVHRLEIQIPFAAVVPEAILLMGRHDLSSSLMALAGAIAGDAIQVVDSADLNQPVDVEVLVGVQKSGQPAVSSIGVWADGWIGYVGDPIGAPDQTPNSAYSFGPYYAACIGAGEVFKRLRRLRPESGKFADRVLFSLWSYLTGARMSDAIQGEVLPKVKREHFYLIGAGAVGQGFAACIASAGVQELLVSVIDHDAIDLEGTNLNRCALSTFGDRGLSKSKITAGFLRDAGISADYAAVDWSTFIRQPSDRGQPRDVGALEREFKFQFIVSCVDKNDARHAIQKCWPKRLVGGSTLDLRAQVTAYDMTTPYECLMCANPLERQGTLNEAADEVLQLTKAQLDLLKDQGINTEQLVRYAEDRKCATVGEEEARKFLGIRVGTRPAVGFVSVAAGVILAVEVLRYLSGLQVDVISRGNSFQHNFLNPSAMRWSKHLRRKGCECTAVGLDRYNSFWR
jgi:molybdopterin/thiamine biosynthesis adenylyltransferase